MTTQLQRKTIATRTALVLGAALMLTASHTAQAQTSSAFGVASDFNVFVFGDAQQTSAAVGGRVAIGDDAKVAYFHVGHQLTNSNGTRDDLIVADTLLYQYGIVYNGNVRYGSYVEFGPRVALLNGILKPGNPINFAAAEQDLKARSTDWAGFAADGTVTVQGGTITLTGTKQGLNIFEVSGTDLSNANSLRINTPAGSTVLINVTGSTVRMRGDLSFALSGVDKQHVVYHFPTTTTLTLQAEHIAGSVFAPYADVLVNQGSMNGQLIAASLSGTGTFCHRPFSGSIGLKGGGGQNLPVQLTAFGAITNGRKAHLTWETAAELNNTGFEVLHAIGNGDFQKLAFIEGHGTTLEAQQYAYTTYELAPGTHRFRLKQIDHDGAYIQTEAVEVSVSMEDQYTIEPAYPNPFNPQTNLSFRVREAQRVTVALYNMLGQRVQVLQEGTVQAGAQQQVRIDGSNLASGAYLVRIAGASFSETQRIVLIK
ncbi:MAG: choice-of-anchor A family protein [Rhodothermales bacterium]